VFYNVTEQEANKFFWQQVLSGDSTDNIPGCYKVGVKKATSMVATMEKDFDMMPAKCWEYIVGAYEESKTKSGCPYHDKPAEQVALETARLVYMQRRPRELWNPPGQEHETLEGADLDD
jgi:5'-3' exonuclease